MRSSSKEYSKKKKKKKTWPDQIGAVTINSDHNDHSHKE